LSLSNESDPDKIINILQERYNNIIDTIKNLKSTKEIHSLNSHSSISINSRYR